MYKKAWAYNKIQYSADQGTWNAKVMERETAESVEGMIVSMSHNPSCHILLGTTNADDGSAQGAMSLKRRMLGYTIYERVEGLVYKRVGETAIRMAVQPIAANKNLVWEGRGKRYGKLLRFLRLITVCPPLIVGGTSSATLEARLPKGG